MNDYHSWNVYGILPPPLFLPFLAMKLKNRLTQNDFEIPLNGSTPYTYLAGRLGGDDSALMASYIKLSRSTAPLHSTLPPVLICLTYRVTGVQTLLDLFTA